MREQRFGQGLVGGGATGGAADTVAPRLLRLVLSPNAFAALPSGPSVPSARARTRGTRVAYRLSETATVTFRIQRASAGRRVNGRCVRPTQGNSDNRRCTRYRTLRGRFSRHGTAGPNHLRFTGRTAGHKLRPGRYRLVATATDAAGNRSKAVRRPFRIIG